jgi:glutathione S-transferase
MIKLYYAPHTCSLASHIALEEAGAAYSTVRIDFASTEQRSPEYLAINPKGRVPAMVTERGILTETPAMLAFIAQSFPQARMAPLDDPFAFAQVQAFNSYLCATLHVAHAHRMRGHRWADDPAAIAAMQR